MKEQRNNRTQTETVFTIYLSNCPSCAFFSLLARKTDNHRHTHPRPYKLSPSQTLPPGSSPDPHAISPTPYYEIAALVGEKFVRAPLTLGVFVFLEIHSLPLLPRSELGPHLTLSGPPPSFLCRKHKVLERQLHNYTIRSPPLTPLRVSHRRLSYIPYIIYERHPVRFFGKAPLRHRQHPALTAQPLYICGYLPRDCVDSIARGSNPISCACSITPQVDWSGKQQICRELRLG